MRRTLLFAVLITLFISSLYAVVSVVNFNGLYYPIDLLKERDISVEKAKCVKIIDENTIEVQYPDLDFTDKVTLLSIEEIEDEQAKKRIIRKNTQYLLNKEVLLSYDWAGMNDKGEILAYVWLPYSIPGDCYDLLWNEILLLNGYGEMSNDAINVFKAVLFTESYKHAREKKLGVWKNIKTEEPINFTELDKDIQEYLVMKYRDGFATKEDSTSASSTAITAYNGDFLNQLLLGMEFGMTVNEVRDNINARYVSIDRFQGSNFDTEWSYGLTFSTLSGSGENQGRSIRRLRQINYGVLGNYSSNEIFSVYSNLKTIFTNSLGEPSSENLSSNSTTWELNEERMQISIFSRSYDTVTIRYTGDLEY